MSESSGNTKRKSTLSGVLRKVSAINPLGSRSAEKRKEEKRLKKEEKRRKQQGQGMESSRASSPGADSHSQPASEGVAVSSISEVEARSAASEGVVPARKDVLDFGKDAVIALGDGPKEASTDKMDFDASLDWSADNFSFDLDLSSNAFSRQSNNNTPASAQMGTWQSPASVRSKEIFDSPSRPSATPGTQAGESTQPDSFQSPEKRERLTSDLELGAEAAAFEPADAFLDDSLLIEENTVTLKPKEQDGKRHSGMGWGEGFGFGDEEEEEDDNGSDDFKFTRPPKKAAPEERDVANETVPNTTEGAVPSEHDVKAEAAPAKVEPEGRTRHLDPVPVSLRLTPPPPRRAARDAFEQAAVYGKRNTFRGGKPAKPSTTLSSAFYKIMVYEDWVDAKTFPQR